jgi:hypothetical protein
MTRKDQRVVACGQKSGYSLRRCKTTAGVSSNKQIEGGIMLRTSAAVWIVVALICFGCSKAQTSLPREPARIVAAAQPEVTESKASKVDCWQRVQGRIGSSGDYGSGWLDLATMSDFKQGVRLRLVVGGTAQKVLVRLLPQGESPDRPSGIAGTFDVATSRKVVVTLDGDFLNVVQISVHGGPNPFGMFPLPGGNGPAFVTEVERSCQ